MKRIIIQNVSKTFRLGFKKRQTAFGRIIDIFSGKLSKRDFKALDSVSFDVDSGEILGLVGSNGAGKTTLLRIISGIFPIYEGTVKVEGKVTAVIGLALGLSSRLTIIENAFAAGSLLGMSQKEIKDRLPLIIKFSELEEFKNTKFYQFSRGMKIRFAVSLALFTNPDILLADEIFALGDKHFKNKVEKKIRDMTKQGVSVVVTSHRLDVIEKYSDKIVWMEKGKIKKQGKAKEVIKEYKKESN